MKKIRALIMGFLLFFALAPYIQAQEYDGDCRFPMKRTYEDSDASGNLKLFKETFYVEGQIVLYPESSPCYIMFDLTNIYGEPIDICIEQMALINTEMLQRKTDRFELVGYGHTDGGDIVTLNAKGVFNKDKDGNVTTISIHGKLSGGNPWTSGDTVPDYTWSANFRSKLAVPPVP